MPEPVYKLIVTGKILHGFSIPEVKENLAVLFKTDVQRIEKVFFLGREVTAKRNLNKKKAGEFLKVFQKSGLACILELSCPRCEETLLAEDACCSRCYPPKNPPGSSAPSEVPLPEIFFKTICPECRNSYFPSETGCPGCGFGGNQKDRELAETQEREIFLIKQVGGPLREKAVNQFISKNVTGKEQIIGTAVGDSGRFFLATDNKIVLFQIPFPGSRKKPEYELKAKCFFIKKISGLELIQGTPSCRLRILLSDGKERSRENSENVFQFNKDHLDEMFGLIQQVREIIELKQEESEGSKFPDITGQIQKLARLKNQGILTEVEFQQKKKELLGRI